MNNLDTLTVEGISTEEFSALKILLDKGTEQVVDISSTRSLIATGAVATAISFLWQHRKEIFEGAKFIKELIDWAQKVAKRRDEETRKTNPPSQVPIILLVRPDKVTLDLLHATPQEVQSYFRGHPNCL